MAEKSRVSTNVMLDPLVRERIDQMAAARHVSVGKVVRAILMVGLRSPADVRELLEL